MLSYLDCREQTGYGVFEVYYESIKREPKRRGINKCRCDERLQTKTKEFTRLPYTGLVLELEHLKIETRLISERNGVSSLLVTRSTKSNMICLFTVSTKYIENP